MIFDNRQKKQYIALDGSGYHRLVGTRDYKIRVRDEADTNFKHPYYEHPRFTYNARSHHIVINDKQTYKKPFSGANILSSVEIRSVAQGSIGGELVLATASIGSKTASANSHVQFEVARNGSYLHDPKMIMINQTIADDSGIVSSDLLLSKSTYHRQGTARIYAYPNDPNRKTFLPRNANTNIYADEAAGDSGGDSGGLTITQYWS